MPARKVIVRCVVCSGSSVVPATDTVLDPETRELRTQCGNTACGATVEHSLGDELYATLRHAGAPEVEELMDLARMELADDTLLWSHFIQET